MAIETAIWALVAYLLGSVPFGLWIGRSRGVDIRTQGSGNIGASNVGRILGKKWGLLCFALDVGKGLVPSLAYGLANGLTHPSALDGRWTAGLWMAVGAAAVVGHMFPIGLKFKGGKGVATGLGALLGVFPVMTLAGAGAFAVWLLVVNASAYIGLASVIAAMSLPILVLALCFGTDTPQASMLTLAVVAVAMSALVIVRHLSNLKRLRAGTEPKVTWGWRARSLKAKS